MKFYAKRAMDKQVEIYRKNNNTYVNMPYWLNYLFITHLTHLEISIGEYHLHKWKEGIYKGAFM